MTHETLTYFGEDRTIESCLKECAEVGEECVKLLCSKSQHPGDEFDAMAMRLGAACDLADCFAGDLSEPDNSMIEADGGIVIDPGRPVPAQQRLRTFL